MLLIALKLFLSFSFAMFGRWLWQLANEWDEKGEIPAAWVETVPPKPAKRSDRGFNSMLLWQKFMALMAFGFAGLFLISILFQLFGAV